MEQRNQKRTASEVQQLLKEKSRQIDQHLQALRDEVSNITPTVKESISKHPLLSVSGALTAGVILGMLLSRQRSYAGGRTLMDAYLAPAVSEAQERISSGENVEDALRTVLRRQLPPQVVAPSAGAELIRILAPMVVGWAAQHLGKKESGDIGEEGA